MFKPLLFTAALTALLLLTSCLPAPSEPAAYILSDASWPTLDERLACLPAEGALLAAHRGTSRKRGLAENAIESLKALHEGGIRLAEIDVAQLKSGEHILFHDGVWDDKSTGKGAVAQSRWRDVQTYLLRDTDGGMSSARPSQLSDALSYAKGRLHLEIDFKSSADYGRGPQLATIFRETEHSSLGPRSGSARALYRSRYFCDRLRPEQKSVRRGDGAVSIWT